MNWVQLTATKELEQLKELSKNNLILIFKHSTKCGTSRTVLSRFERAWREEEMKKVKPYFLDLLVHRDVSDKIEEGFGIIHESPQLLLIKDGKCIFNVSHYGVDYMFLKNKLFKILKN
jgi:bacillithiol system protein YtxJ